MRLIGTLKNQIQAREFSYFLQNQGIVNQCEIDTNTDWGSPQYGDVNCKIWVTNEDQVEDALKYFDEFNHNPSDPRFTKPNASKSPIPPPETMENSAENTPDQIAKKFGWNIQPMGLITLYLLIICSWIFIWGETTRPHLHKVPINIPLTPIAEPPIYKKLVYDYPRAYEIIDKLVVLYGVDKLANPAELPIEGKYLFEEYLHTPFFQGIYSNLVSWMNNHSTRIFDPKVPMFEKIRQGEYWRLFTPCILHANLFHILFNMIWLVILGKQIEVRLGGFRYILFILVTGIFSNTVQYFISGANFVGISGVLTAMFAFIWMRQRVAAWEGYPLQYATITFIAFFILAMAGLQLTSFFLEVYYNTSISPGIANTAHLSGALMGAILGRLKFFSWRT